MIFIHETREAVFIHASAQHCLSQASRITPQSLESYTQERSRIEFWSAGRDEDERRLRGAASPHLNVAERDIGVSPSNP